MGKELIRFVPIVAVLLGLAGPAHAVNDKQIKAAINAAIAFLKSQPTNVQQGTVAAHYQEGAIGLMGIALMEAGVDPGDPFIQEIAKSIRAWAVKQSNTYQLSVDIIFLDKLGEDVDTTLIQSMGSRLVRGQSSKGGWGYHCPTPDANEQTRLANALAGASMKGKKGDPVGLDPSTRPKLDPAVEDQLKGPQAATEGADDNSNTQFALLGLWTARRHGVPVDDALGRLDRRLRSLQLTTGGWAYSTDPNLSQASSAAMTCAGLLGLAVTAGNRGERSMKAGTIDSEGRVKAGAPSAPSEPKKIPNLLQTDRNVIAGFKYLGQVLNGDPLAIGPSATLVPTPGTATGVAVSSLASDLYFMWSLERVCMVYGIGHVGGKDWYAWGADQVVATQKSNGSWMGGRNFGADIDTSFALMFLCRSNIVKDLSSLLANRRMTASTGALKPSAAGKPSGSATVKGPPDKSDDTSDPAALAKALATATGTKYAELLKQFTDSKGPVFTQALAAAIPQLTGEAQKQARDALADRMTRFSAETLKDRLRDSDREIRCAAALAVCMRDEQVLIPELIDTLNDSDDLVARAARRALKGLSEKDFGPAAGASAAQKRQAIADWKAWWDSKKKN